MNTFKTKYWERWILSIIFICSNFSCSKFLETPLDNSKILSRVVFADDGNATNAIRGIYQKMALEGFLGGGTIGVSLLTGLSSDELHNIQQNSKYIPFENNNILSSDVHIQQIWKDTFALIYQANDILEGLEESNSITDGVKSQLKGEALFARAFCYFYLVNLFGDVPLVLTSNYIENSLKPRVSSAAIYNQIITDLLESQQLMKVTYPELEKVRPNKFVATALLARVYLYRGDWLNAQAQSTKVINEGGYSINTDVNQVFLKASEETIWQLASEQDLNTYESGPFLLHFGMMEGSAQLTTALLNSFEADDLRKTSWLGEYIEPITLSSYFYPSKYKEPTYGTTDEYFVVFRLAEQYLIRAEAAAQLGNLEQAISDIDQIRERTGLDLVHIVNPSVSKQALLDIIAHERRIEFFAEWGHRWFDLKRTGNAVTVLQGLKPGLSSNDLLYPIPQSEFLKNPNLGTQNSGY